LFARLVRLANLGIGVGKSIEERRGVLAVDLVDLRQRN
jgi:hypothetical protein